MARDRNGIAQSTWQHLSTSLAANSKDLPHLDGHRTRLAEVLTQAEDLTAQQAALRASKQEASKKLAQLMGEGRKLATFLRVGVKQHYGNRAEKLVEFGLQPLRTRHKAAAVPPTTPPTPEKPTPATPSTGNPPPGTPAPSSTGAPSPAGSGH